MMRIALLVLPGVQMLDVAGPMDVFSEACRLLGKPDAYTLQVISLSTTTVTASSGVRLLPDASLADACDDIDTLLVTGSPRLGDYLAVDGLTDWLVRQARRVRRLGSVCSGTFLLAHARLLTGRHATTHWGSVARLARDYPEIRVETDPIYVKDGSIYTSAGVSAGMDLALAMVEEDYGRRVALQVARELVMVFKRPGSEPQLSLHLNAQFSERRAVADVQDWIPGHLSADLTVGALAGQVGMSVRNFSRTFKRDTGHTPADFVEIARVQAAGRLLRESEMPIKKIAFLCGFSDQNALRRALMRRLALAPVAYRRRYRESPPAPCRAPAAAHDSERMAA
ncbi:GlxA family transcriptional regulator [Cupriavidus sp. RAF12]